MPREWTRPLVEGPPGPCGCGCALTPETSLGFAFEEFCREVVHRPLDPWQRWLGIHGLEMLPDGRPRFRQILVLVARQNGKTELLVLLTLFWMYVLGVGMVLGTSTKLDYARESWLKVVKLARSVPELRAEIAKVRNANGEQEISTVGESRYKIAASNDEGGRSLTVHRLVEDELRQHRDWSAHEAAENAMNAVLDAQAWAISNEGDDRAVVLTALKKQALDYIATGAGDERLGYFGWTAPAGCAPDDLDALAAANPNLGRRIDVSALHGKAVRAREAGGEQEAKFRTEVLCQRVASLTPPPIPESDWDECADLTSSVPGAVVLAVAVSIDGEAASIAAAGLREDGIPHGELIANAPGTDWVVPRMRALLERWELRRIKRGDDLLPAVLLDPVGPAGRLLTSLRAAGIDPYLITGSMKGQACGELQAATRSRAVRLVTQPGDRLHEALCEAAKRDVGDGAWAWGRKASGVDISPLEAITEALWGLSVAEATPPQPFFASRR